MQQYYPTEITELNIARGLVKGTSFVHRVGAVPSMATSNTGTVWDVNNTIYPWSEFDTANTLVVDCADPGDVGKQVTVVGLDEDYNALTETISLDTQTGNDSVNVFKRIFNAYFVNGVSVLNADAINIKLNGTIVAKINADVGETLMSVYTIPAGYKGYLLQGTASNAPGDIGTGDFYLRYFDENNFRIGHAFEVSGSQYLYKFSVPIEIPEKTDLDVRVSTGTSNKSRITASYDILLIKEGLG